MKHERRSAAAEHGDTDTGHPTGTGGGEIPDRESMVFRARRARARVAFDLGEHLVVVGCGPVAARLVDDLLPLVRKGLLHLTVLGAEPHPAYNRVLVGEYAVGRVTREALTVADVQTWREAGVTVHLGTEVVGIDRTRRLVKVRHDADAPDTDPPDADAPGTDAHGGVDHDVSWDRLVLVTGARPVRPNMRGLDPSPDGAALPSGVVTLRDLDDAEAVRTVVGAGGHVVVLGGGVLGVEAALAAAETAGTATLVHTGDEPMERMLPASTAQLLGDRLKAAGVHCVSARAVGVSTDANGGFAALEVASRAPLTGDLLVISCGVQARTALAEGAGLRTQHGIVVDHELQADAEGRVYAMGDCAEVLCRDPGCQPCTARSRGAAAPGQTGTIAPGWRQAEYLSARIAAELTALQTQNQGAVPVEPMPAHAPAVLRLKAKDIDLTVLDSGRPAPDRATRHVEFTDTALRQDLQVTLHQDGSLRYAVVLGRPRALAHLTAVLESGEPMRGDLTYLLSLDSTWAAPVQEGMGESSVVCRCAGVTRGTLESAVEDGAVTVESVTAATRACTGCGTCRPEIEALLAQRRRDRSPGDGARPVPVS